MTEIVEDEGLGGHQESEGDGYTARSEDDSDDPTHAKRQKIEDTREMGAYVCAGHMGFRKV
jgi:hypothetical protein